MAKGAFRLALIGADELSTAFLSIPQAMRRGVLTKAVRKASRIMVGPLRRATPKRKTKRLLGRNKNPPGTLRKSTGVAIRKYRGGAIAAAYIGHRWPKGAAAHLLIGGTKDRHQRNSQFTGRVSANDFFTPIANASKLQVWLTLRRELAAGLAAARVKAAVKALRKGARL